MHGNEACTYLTDERGDVEEGFIAHHVHICARQSSTVRLKRLLSGRRRRTSL